MIFLLLEATLSHFLREKNSEISPSVSFFPKVILTLGSYGVSSVAMLRKQRKEGRISSLHEPPHIFF